MFSIEHMPVGMRTVAVQVLMVDVVVIQGRVTPVRS